MIAPRAQVTTGMTGTSSLLISSAAVLSTRWSSLTSWATSRSPTPASLGSITANSITIRRTRRNGVGGRVYADTILGLPFAVGVIPTITRFAP